MSSESLPSPQILDIFAALCSSSSLVRLDGEGERGSPVEPGAPEGEIATDCAAFDLFPARWSCRELKLAGECFDMWSCAVGGRGGDRKGAVSFLPDAPLLLVVLPRFGREWDDVIGTEDLPVE